MRSVYIHIPFCKSICSYCDFCKFYYKESWALSYMEVLKDEILKYYEEDDIKSIYIGGGSPSSLSIDCLEKLFEIIKVFKVIKDCEITFECNVNDINEELLKILKINNVNRISIGVQSFNKKKLKYLNRNHNKKQIINNIKLCKNYGFDNINVDFMYALPIETYRMMKSDLKKFLKLKIEHISTYSLIIEDHTVLKNIKAKPLNEDLEYKMYKYILKKTKKYGFKHYEVSNFALNNHESIHNKTYWKNEEYYGFGLSSHGFINGVRYENTRNFNKYLNGDYRLNELLVSTEEDMENEVMLGFRLMDGISISHFKEKFGYSIDKIFKIKEAIKKGYLIKENDYIKIPENKIYVMNEIINFIME